MALSAPSGAGQEDGPRPGWGAGRGDAGRMQAREAPGDQSSLYSPSTVSSSVSGRPEPSSPAPPS